MTVSPSKGGSVSPSAGSFNEGTSVSIAATPSPGYVFKEWSGDITSTSNPISRRSSDYDFESFWIWLKKSYFASNATEPVS